MSYSGVWTNCFLTSLAKEKGMTSVATSMSAEARETRKRFWGALRALLVNTATTTSTLPTTVPRMMTVTTNTMNTDATCEWGGREGDLGEEEDVWFSREEFGDKVAGIVAITGVSTSDKSILVKWLTFWSPFFWYLQCGHHIQSVSEKITESIKIIKGIEIQWKNQPKRNQKLSLGFQKILSSFKIFF